MPRRGMHARSARGGACAGDESPARVADTSTVAQVQDEPCDKGWSHAELEAAAQGGRSSSCEKREKAMDPW